MTAARTSAFYWRDNTAPTIFAQDRAFTGRALDGRTQGELATEAVERRTRETGRSPGSLYGVSAKGNRLIAEGNQRRRVAKR